MLWLTDKDTQFLTRFLLPSDKSTFFHLSQFFEAIVRVVVGQSVANKVVRMCVIFKEIVFF